VVIVTVITTQKYRTAISLLKLKKINFYNLSVLFYFSKNFEIKNVKKQACRQEMKWGGVFFCKKKWTLPPQNETKLNQTLFFNFTFYSLGRGAYAPNAPPCLRA